MRGTKILLIPFAFLLIITLFAHHPNHHPADARQDEGAILLQSSLASEDAISNPASGAGGYSTLPPENFVTVDGRAGAQFTAPEQVAVFPVMAAGQPNINLNQGSVTFWYRPNYDAAADDVGHALLTAGDVYNAPRLELVESDALYLRVTDADWNTVAVSAGYRAPVWSAGQWVEVRADWDTDRAGDSLALYVDGVRVDEGGAAGGWNLAGSGAINELYIGAGNLAGDFSADGVISELTIRGEAGDTAPSADEVATATTEPTAAPTMPPVATEGCLDRSDPNALAPIPDLPLPPPGVPFTDPAFCTELVRISDTSEQGAMETQEYSQLQAFSPTNEYVLLTSYQGYLVRELGDWGRVDGLVSEGWNAARWYPPLPNTLIHFDTNADETLVLQLTDVASRQTRDLFTFPEPYQRLITNASSDELSRDGRWLAGIASQADGTWVIFAFDTVNQQLGAELPIPELYATDCQPDPEWGEVTPDWVGVSPLGDYLVVQWTRDGTARCSGLETFDIQTGEWMGRPYDGHQHGDLGVDVDGRQFFMTFDTRPDGRMAIGYRELPGPPTVDEPDYLTELEWGNAGHISCRGPAGVCLVTADGDLSNGLQPFEAEIFLQFTDGRVVRVAHHMSSVCGYWVQPRASLSSDGDYAIFASDWGRQLDCDDLGRGDPYVVDLGFVDYGQAAALPDAPSEPVEDEAPADETSAQQTESVSFEFEAIDNSFQHGQLISVADIEGDGDADIVLASSLDDAVYLYLNDGAGDFSRVTVAGPGSIVAMDTALADFDSDGDLDIAAVGLFDRLACEFCSPGVVDWYANPGDPAGEWARQRVTAELWGPLYISAGDLNGDGQPDLVVATINIGGSGGGAYWFANEGGAFSSAQAIDAGLGDVTTARAIDLNQDGLDDVLAAGQTAGEVVAYLSLDNGARFERQTLAAIAGPYDIASADMNGDGTRDALFSSAGLLAWVDDIDTEAPPLHVIDPDFGAGNASRLLAGDLNGDGRVDVAATVSNRNTGAGELRLYINHGDDTWTRQVIEGNYFGLTDVAGADVDGDGRVDLLTSTYEHDVTDDLAVWWNRP